jgi:hypothetical protein
MASIKTNVGTLVELTKGKVTAVSSKKLSLHDFQKVTFPLNENMRTTTNFGHQLIVLILVYCGSFKQ